MSETAAKAVGAFAAVVVILGVKYAWCKARGKRFSLRDGEVEDAVMVVTTTSASG